MAHKILIVDDQADNLAAIIKYIEEDNSPYELLQALNAELALLIAQKEEIDLIITDWEMPGTNGIELIKSLKSKKETKDIPVIMCTGVMTSSKNLEMALEAGAVDYIRKPIDKIELLARIYSALNLSKSYQEIKKLSESKDKIFSIIAHDLRTPVGNIKNFAKWILDQENSYDQKKLFKLLDTIHSQSSSTFQTLETLLNWAQCQTNSVLYEPTKNNINSIINDALVLFTHSAETKNINFNLKIDTNINGFFDSAMIATVMRNLIANALKYSKPESSITIEASQNEKEIIICIKDKGIGIPKKRIEKLFDTTNYESTYGTNNEKGSGLGLKICKEFIELHQGKLTVKSYTNKGSSFCFNIPQPRT